MKTLSDKIHRQKFGVDVYIAMDDVKEFIRQLKEEFTFIDRNDAKRFDEFIKKKVGEKLI